MSLSDEERRIIVGLEYEKACKTLTLRNNSDYNCSFDATEEEIKPLIEPTKQLIEDIGKYIQCTGV